MSISKQAKDYAIKIVTRGKSASRELSELQEYFKAYRTINFKFDKEYGTLIARSTDFKYGSIITFGETQEELEEYIKDAILTAFEVPSVYAKEASIHKEGEEKAYACA